MNGLVVTSAVVEREGLPVVKDVSLSVQPGKIAVLLGANGAGKTTLMMALAGLLPLAGGSIVLNDRDLRGARVDHRARAGLALVEEGRSVFRELSVEENLKVGLRGTANLSQAYDLFPELLPRRTTKAGLLSGGEQQMLVIARALLTEPLCLLVDELSSGLAPVVTNRLMKAMRQLANAGLAILMVEQFARAALSIADTAFVLRRGHIVFGGRSEDLRVSDDEIHALYLGKETG
jgi:branched-chain amino acid transport system ATP-binding protein